MQLIIILFSILGFNAHELHLSMCNISYNEEEQRIEVQQRVYYDDLESSFKVILKNNKFDILKPEDSGVSLDSLILAYTNEKLDLEVNGEEVDLSLLDYEISDDAFVIYLYKSNIKKITSLQIYSHLLFEIFNDQDNVISVMANGKKKSQKFSYNSKPYLIQYDWFISWILLQNLLLYHHGKYDKQLTF